MKILKVLYLTAALLVAFSALAASPAPQPQPNKTTPRSQKVLQHKHLTNENMKDAKAQCGCYAACHDAAMQCLEDCIADGNRSGYCDTMCSEYEFNCDYACGPDGC